MHISYSQFSRWTRCPYAWKLKYIDGIRLYSGSIHTVFGTAIHKTIQYYLTIMYADTVKKANELDLNLILKTNMMEAYRTDKERNNNSNFVSAEELSDLYNSGVEILKSFKSHRRKYYNTRYTNLIGVEVPINYEINPGLFFRGSLDVVIKDNDKVNIQDIKTSYRGWKKNKKDDFITRAQLILYREFYSKQYNVSKEDITIEFFILKKQIWEQSEWPQKRIQLYSPPSGKVTVNKVMKKLDNFVDCCFDGNIYKKECEYNKAKYKTMCKWCEYKGTTYCDR